jgi:hypothetical protein
MLGGIGGIAPLYFVGDKAEVEGGLFTYHQMGLVKINLTDLTDELVVQQLSCQR